MTPAPPAPILLSPPLLTGRELPYLSQMLESGWLAPAGPWLERFEAALGAAVAQPGGAPLHAAALSSGTAALHLALRLLGVGPGDVVLSATLTFVGAANPIVYLGATPAFVDAEAATYGIAPAALAQALAHYAQRGIRPRALVLTHLYGRAADLDAILPLCAAHGVPLVEDAAEALGATHAGRPLGAWGQLGIYSFNGNKVISTGGGGALVGADAAAVARARALAAQARQPAAHYEHAELGYTYRMPSLAAAVGLAQLEALAERVARRRAIWAGYHARLEGLPGLHMPPLRAGDSAWLSTLQLDPAAAPSPEALRLRLAQHHIEARPLWKPMHLQPLYRQAPTFGGAVSERLFATGLCLPSGSGLTEADLDRVCAVIRGAWA